VDTVSSSSNGEERDSFDYEEDSYMMARSVKDNETRSKKQMQPSDSSSHIPHDRDLNIKKRSSKVNSSVTESKVIS